MDRLCADDLQILVDHVGEAVFLLDDAGKLLTWNPAAERIFGYEAQHALALHIRDLYPAGADVLDGAAQSRITTQGWQVHRTGRRVWLSTVVCPVRSAEDTLRGYAMIVRDDTVLREAELLLETRTKELQRSNTELEAFAGIAAHDLQEPLRKIRMFCDRQRVRCGADMSAAALALTDRMEDAAARMQRLIDAFLDYASLNRRNQRHARVNLDDMVRLVRTDLEQSLHQSGGMLEVEPMPTISADPTLMHQLLQNLISNALNFARPGVKPVVRVTSDVDTAGTCTIRVEDNGIGFAPHHAERIFGLLQRLHGRHEYEGTGMGLAICRRITDFHGGTIVAVGSPGAGAVFTVSIPAQPLEEGIR